MIERIETIPVRVPLTRLYQGSYYKMRNRCTIITRVRTRRTASIGQAYNADTDEEQDEVAGGSSTTSSPPCVIGLDERADRAGVGGDAAGHLRPAA